MKHLFFITAMAFLLAGCGQKASKQEETQEENIAQHENIHKELNTLQVGEVKATWIQDVKSKQSPAIFPDASASLIDSLGLQDGIPSSISTFLVQTDSTVILFDTGLGKENSRMIYLLDSVGVKPADIRYLYLTHLHGDHIGGMMNGNERVFPHAAVYLAKQEYDGWMQMADDKKAQVVKTLNAYKAQLHLFAFGDTLPGNVVALDAAGHTPGHTVYQAGKLLVVGDILHGNALQLLYPEICPTYDMDKEKAIESRKRILDYALKNDLMMAGMHFPSPGFVSLMQ